MTTSGVGRENPVPTEAGLIPRCRGINKQLEEALAITVEIAGQYYDDDKIAKADEGSLTGSLLSEIQSIGYKVNDLLRQLNGMKEQF